MAEIFQNRGIKSNEAVDKQKEKEKIRELTPEEKKYVLNHTPLGIIITDLEENPDPDLIRAKKRRNGTWGIETLYNYKIINKKYGLVKINYENLVKIWENTKGPKILKLFKNKSNGLTINQIYPLLETSYNEANNEISKLKDSGLLSSQKIGKERVFFIPKRAGKK